MDQRSLLLSRYVQAAHWDEALSMSIGSSTSDIVSGPPFLAIDSPKSLTLLTFNDPHQTDAALEQALGQVVSANRNKRIVIEAGAFGPVALDAQVLLRLGFAQAKEGATPRVKALTATAAAPQTPSDAEAVSLALPEGLRLIRVFPTSPEWGHRIDIERILFYAFDKDGSYCTRLKIALEDMCAKGDENYLTMDGDSVAGYMTMRYGRDVAYLQGAGVLEQYRKKGITRAMLNVCVQDAIAKGFDSMVTAGWGEQAERAWIAMGFTLELPVPKVYRREVQQI
ncbi:hypothetical protein M427DRAFT_58999 [Gonapodya prolifera JEL478]|uniref:N-acetyltransferase domain-containing protein n=1 Tax=Gonapodya prolifera (strain JEL478) TaxID=1344416 RepID=A0A139A8I8_GONPJ|nr:hypothetical protein M427DRAFT_58999 [Gonapodya prolifera JEL478]|eukprot:KXS13100.1 hypothetical protein M427DRAFT_58999 [Gonapodya prolifera JEL478]